MAEKTLNTRQKQKYDTSTNWTTNNPVLLAGELGIESDTNKFKIGNGTSAWNELDYAGGSEIPLYSTTGQNTDGAMTQKATTDALPQAVSFDLSPELNFDSISMTNEQFNLLLANPENVLIVNVVDDNDDTMTFSWIFHRSQYMKITTDEVTQELLTFNCDEATQAGSVAQVIQNLTFVRLSTSPDIVVMDYRIDFTSFATRSDLTDYVPKTRTINGKSLSNDISLTATDVNALPDTTEIPTALSDLNEDSSHRTVTDTEKSTWNAKSDFDGDYNDLTNKPTIPTINVNGVAQPTLNFDSDPQAQIDNRVTLDTEQLIKGSKKFTLNRTSLTQINNPTMVFEPITNVPGFSDDNIESQMGGLVIYSNGPLNGARGCIYGSSTYGLVFRSAKGGVSPGAKNYGTDMPYVQIGGGESDISRKHIPLIGSEKSSYTESELGYNGVEYGCVKFSNGLQICTGVLQHSSEITVVNISDPFLNEKAYNVFEIGANANSGYAASFSASPVSSSSFNLRYGTSTQVYGRWIAIGWWK